MATLGRLIRNVSPLRDMRRDWRRWSGAERCGALMIAVALLALPAAMFIAGNPI